MNEQLVIVICVMKMIYFELKSRIIIKFYLYMSLGTHFIYLFSNFSLISIPKFQYTVVFFLLVT